MASWSGWGGLNLILDEAEEKKKAEERRKKEEDAALQRSIEELRLTNQMPQEYEDLPARPVPVAPRPAPTPKPVQPVVPDILRPVYDKPPTTPLPGPEVSYGFDRPDTGAPPISSSDTINRRPQPQRRSQSVVPDVLRDPQPRAWQPIEWYTPEPQARLTPEEEKKKEDIYATGQQPPQPPAWLQRGMNWLGEKVQQGSEWAANQDWTDVMKQGWDMSLPAVGLNAYMSTPAYRFAQERSIDRRAQPPDAPGVAWQNQVGNVPGIPAPSNILPGLIGEGWNRLMQNPAGREVSLRAQDVIDRTFDVPGTIVSDTRIPGTGLSLTEIFQPIGEEINQNFNPFNPNVTDNPYAPFILGLQMLLDPGWEARVVGEAKPEFDAARQAVADAVAEGVPDAELALRNLGSGPQAVLETLYEFTNPEGKAQELEQEAMRRQAFDPEGAGKLLAQAQEIRQRTPAQKVQEYMNPWAEVVRGVVADPTEFVTPIMPLLVEGYKLGKARNLFKVSPEEAARLLGNLPDAKRVQEAISLGPTQAKEAWRAFIDPYRTTPEKLWGWLPDLLRVADRSARSKAELDATRTWQAVLKVIAEYDDKEDVGRILSTLAQNPRALVDGIDGLKSDVARRLRHSDGLWRWDQGLIANQEFGRLYPIVAAIGERIPDLHSLKGTGKVVREELVNELYENFYDVARRFNGVHQTNLPWGAADVRIVRNPDGSGVLEYVDKQGKVVRRTEPLDYAEAQASLREVKDALNRGAWRRVGDGLQFINTIQKEFLNDAWLGLRPANWIGNALSGTVNTFAIDAYTFKPLGGMIDHLNRQLGGYPATPSMFGIETGKQLGRTAGQEFSGSLIGRLGGLLPGRAGRTIQGFMKGVYGIPYGATELKLPGGVAIPIGEEAFRTRAFYVPFQRVFRGEWRNSVDGQLVPKLMQAAGLTPEQAKMVGDLVYTLGENGGKLDIMSGLRKWVGKPQLKPTLQSLGIPPELLSPSAVRDIENLIVDALPQDAPEVMRRISEILMRERNPAGQIMSLAGVQPGIRSWSDVDLADEVAWLTANLLGDARRAGLDPTAVQTQAQAIAKAYVDARTQSFERLAGDIAQAENNPNLWSITMDYFTDLIAKRNAARATVDAASQEAVRLGTPDAWQRKWQITQQAWENLGKEFLALSDEYRALLAQPGEYKRRHDWWDTISKYLAWDEAEFRRIRGIDLGSVGDESGETWQRVINNNREFVDNKLFELFGAFQRYPSLENFDVVRYTIQRIESIGAQTAATLADARQSLAEGKMSKTAYAKLRNKLWNAMFDSQAIQAEEMARAVVMNGLAEQTQSGLRWFDPFNNQEYRLLGKAENGKWKALNVETGEEELFDAASSMNEVAPFVVPLDVVNDFERMTGNDLTPEIDQVLGDIASQRPTNLRPDLRPPFEGAQSPNAPVLTPAQRGLSPADQAMTGVPAQSAPTADELAQAVGAAQNRRAMSGTPESVDDPLGYNQFADVIGQNVPRSVQDQFQVHGTDAQGAIRLLEGGVDPSRPLQSGAPIDYSGQGGVLGTRSQNPVLVISAPGQPIDEVRNVVLNGPAADTIDLWRQRYPGVNFMTVEEAAEWMQGGQRLSPAERAMTLRENMFPAGDDLPLLSGTTYGPADKGPFVPGEPPARQIPPVQRSLVGRPPARETAPMSQELTQGRFVPPASGEQTVATVPTDNELRQLAIDAGISTAGETGTPNNRWLLNVLNKDLGIQVDSLGQLSDAERILARQALQERAAKSVTTPQRAVTPDVAPVDYRRLTKAQIIAQYGDELAEQGITPAKAKRMTKRELDVALGRADETPLTTTGDLAQEEIEGLRDARDSIRREWDAKVASQVEGIPQIDVLIMRFKRDGGVNLNVGAGKTTGLEKLYAPDEALKGGKKAADLEFEDIYGIEVAGYEIRSQDDLYALLSDYSKMQEQIRTAEGAVQESQRFTRMSTPEIVEEIRPELIEKGFTEAEIDELLTMDRRTVLDTYDSVVNEALPGDMRTYEFGFDGDYISPVERLQRAYGGDIDLEVYKLLGVEEGTPLRGTLMDYVRKSRQSNGAGVPHVGDIAQAQVNTIDDLERTLAQNLASILAGKPNELTTAQRLRLLDTVSDFLPQYDQSVAIGARVGDEMSNWAMLNYGDRRNIDTVAGILMPYWYFWSRMPVRVAATGLQKPSLINKVYEIMRGIELENEQSGVPARMEGTLPLPQLAGSEPGTAYRINVSNLFRYIIPNYMEPNPYVDPESPGGGILRWIPGMYPLQQMLYQTVTGQEVTGTLNNLLPIPPSSVYQAATGEMPPMRQGIYGWAANPDQWDEYRARRAISTIAVEEDLDKALVAYANQVVRNQASGRNPTEGIPPEWAQEAQLLAARGVRQAGQERLMGRGFSYTTGMPVYPYHQGEQEAQALQSAYFAAGYNPETNLGSKGLQGRILDATPDLANWWAKNDEEPGKRGRQTELYRQKQALLRQKEEAVRQALDDAPIETMSKGEIYDLRQKAAEPYDKQIDEIDAELKPLQEELRSPNASLLQGYAPGEIRQKAITGVLWQAAQLPGKPEWPGDEATNAEKEAYFDALAEWERQREDYVVNALSPTPLPGDLPDQGGPVLASENEARELWWHFQNDYRTPRERARLETLDREQGYYDSARQANYRNASERIPAGEGYLKRYLEASGDERDALKAQDWRYAAAPLAAYNPDVWDGVTAAVGKDAIKQYYEGREAKPEWPGEGASEEEMKAYYKALNEWSAQYPLYEETEMWLWGRDRWGTYDRTNVPGQYNAGADYAEAKELFGDDIFDVLRAADAASLAGTWSQWRNSNPDDYKRMLAYNEWHKALGKEPTSSAMLPQAQWGVNPAEQRASIAPGDPRQGLSAAFAQTGTPDAAQLPNRSFLPFTAGGNVPAMGTAAGMTDPQTGTGPQMAGITDPQTGTGPQMAGITDPDILPGSGEGGDAVSAWAMQNEDYAEWEGRKQGVYATFGPETGQLYEEYLALPKGEPRRMFKAEHPELRAVSLYTWNPNEYNYLVETYGQDGVMAWAMTPAYADTDEARARRNAYYDQHPEAWEINAWLYGRPGGDESDITDDDTFSYNFGKDYEAAIERFGPDIWTIVGNYKRGWDKETKGRYYDQYPVLSDFFDWWYGNLPDNYSKSNRTYYSRGYGGYGRGYGYYGGRGNARSYRSPYTPYRSYYRGGGGWSSYELEPGEYNMDVYIGARAYNPALRVGREDIPRYRRTQFQPYRGSDIGPDPIRRWQPPRWH